MNTTTLTFGPFHKPLSRDLQRRVRKIIKTAEKKGYAVVAAGDAPDDESDVVKVVMVKTVSAPELAGAGEEYE